MGVNRFGHGLTVYMQYVFPCHSLSPDEQDGVIRRFHMSETGLQKAVKAAVQKAGIPKKVGCHTFRRGFHPYMDFIELR